MKTTESVQKLKSCVMRIFHGSMMRNMNFIVCWSMVNGTVDFNFCGHQKCHVALVLKGGFSK